MKKSVYALQNHNWATTGCFCVCDLQRWSHSRGACEWCVCVFSGWRALKGHFFSFFFVQVAEWVGRRFFFFFTQLLCCRGMIGVWVSDHQKKKKKNPLQNRRRAQKHCSKKRAKGSCDRSRCARWPDFHNQEEDFFIIIFFYVLLRPEICFILKNATHIPATEAATAQKSPGRYNANVVGGFDFSQPLRGSCSVWQPRRRSSPPVFALPPRQLIEPLSPAENEHTAGRVPPPLPPAPPVRPKKPL